MLNSGLRRCASNCSAAKMNFAPEWQNRPRSKGSGEQLDEIQAAQRQMRYELEQLSQPQ